MVGFGSRLRKQLESVRPTPSSTAASSAPSKNIRNLTRLSGGGARAPVPVQTPSLKKENGGQDASVSLIGRGWGGDAASAVEETGDAPPWTAHPPTTRVASKPRWGDEEDSDEEVAVLEEEPNDAPVKCPDTSDDDDRHRFAANPPGYRPNHHRESIEPRYGYDRRSSYERRSYDSDRRYERGHHTYRHYESHYQRPSGRPFEDGSRWGFAKRSSHFERSPEDYYPRSDRYDADTYERFRRREEGPSRNEDLGRSLSEARPPPGASRSISSSRSNELSTPMVLLRSNSNSEKHSGRGTAATAPTSTTTTGEESETTPKKNASGTAWTPQQSLPVVEESEVRNKETPLAATAVAVAVSSTPEKSAEETAAEQQQKVLQQVADRRAAAATSPRKLWTDPDKPKKPTLDTNHPKPSVTNKRPNPCRIEGHDHDWKDCPRNTRSEHYNHEPPPRTTSVDKPNPCNIEGHDHDWKDCPNNPKSENFERNNPCRIDGHEHDWNDCPSNPKSDNYGKWPKGERRRGGVKDSKERGVKKSKKDIHVATVSDESDSESRTKVEQKQRLRKESKKSKKVEKREGEGKKTKLERTAPVEETNDSVVNKDTKADVAQKSFLPAPPPAISAWKSGPPSAVKQVPTATPRSESPPTGATSSAAKTIPPHPPKEQLVQEVAPTPIPAPPPSMQETHQPTLPTSFVSSILPNPGPTALFPGNSALFGDSQSTVVYGSWNPPPMVLPNTFVDPWKPNPFAPTTSMPAPAMGAQFGSIWSHDSVAAPTNTSQLNETHRPLYASNTMSTASVTNDTATVPELSFGKLSINDETSNEHADVTEGGDETQNNGDTVEVKEGVNGEDRPPHQGKKGGRFGGRSGRGGRGGRSGRGGRGRGGREGRSTRIEKSNEQTDDDKANKASNTGKPVSLGEDKRSGRGRGSNKGRGSGRGKPFKKGPPKDKASTRNDKPAAAASASESAT